MGLFTPDTSFYSDYTDKGKYLLTWRLSLLLVGIFFLLSLTFFFINFVAFLFYFVAFVLGIFGVVYLVRVRRYRPLFWMYSVGATILVFLSLHSQMEMVHSSEYFWVVSIVIFTFIGLDRKTGVIFLVINALSITSHLFFQLNKDIAMMRQQTPVELLAILVEILLASFMIGYLLHQYLLFQSYAENQLKLANEELAAQNQVIVKKNEENSMLAKEIHHRVKNNLQIVISLLRMHSEEVKSEETKHHFAEAMNRIMSMSLIHQKLYQEKELSNIDFDSYIRDLAFEIVSSSRHGHRGISCDIASDVRKVGLKTIVPLGLLLNELMTNSLKHAFRDSNDGEIRLRVKETPEKRIVLEYCDTGSWKAEKPVQEGFGLELIELLTGQLEGSFERSESCYRFELANLDH